MLPGFASKEYSTVPSPLPELPELIVNQSAFELAVQEHPPSADTFTVALDAPGPTEAALELKE
jgi:hypothetical protein